MKRMQRFFKVTALLLLAIIVVSGCTDTDTSGSARRVTIVVDGEVCEGFGHHWFFRSPCGAVAGGIDIWPDEVADELTPLPLGVEFEILIEGEQYRRPRYSFYKLTDGEWVRALAVRPGEPNEVFVTHGHHWRSEAWEQVDTDSFLDLLAPGEYILEVAVSWGNAQSGYEGQYFFRLIK